MSTEPLFDLALSVLHGASLLDTVPVDWRTLPALRTALQGLVPATHIEVVCRDPRQCRFERIASPPERDEVTRGPVPNADAFALCDALGRSARRYDRKDLGPALPGQNSGVVAPLSRLGVVQGWLAFGGTVSSDPSAAQVMLIGDLAQLIGAALANEIQTDALRAQGEIAHVLAQGADLKHGFGAISELARRIIAWDAIALVRPDGADRREVIAALGTRADLLAQARSTTSGAQSAIFCRTTAWPATESFEQLSRAGIRSVMQVPLLFKSEPVGLLAFASHEAWAYEKQDLARTESLAALLAAHLALQFSIRQVGESEARYKHLYHQIATAHSKLVQAEKLASVGQLAAGVAHEINNPAAVVMSNLSHLSVALPEGRRLLSKYRSALRAADPAAGARLAADEKALEMPTLDSEVDEAISESLNAMRRIRDIVRSLMRFARGPAAAPELVNLRDLCDRAITVAQNEIRHRARLVRDYQLVPSILCDAASLEQVLVNVLLNAAQAIPEGSAEAHEIRVRLAEDGGHVVLEVRDDGVGIPADVLPRIFDPFFTTKPVGQGTGLGLSIAHDVMTKHGGEIHVESEVGRGTTVRMRLQMPERREPAAAPAAAKRHRVMIIDDELPVLRAAERLLRAQYDTVCVASGDEALKYFEASPAPDLILCDLMMPAMTGMDLYDQIVERFAALAGRVVFMTGGAFTPRAREFAEKMANRLVEKPLEGRELREIVQRHLPGANAL
jgi:signal transduction histidine kinase